jgi:hypothetical protein
MAGNTVRNRNIKLWIIFSVIVGLIPIGIRLVSLGSEIYREVFDPMDILGDSIVFGLILNIVNIHNIDNIKIYDEGNTKFFKGGSLLLIVFLAVVDILFILREIIKYSTPILIFLSILFNTSTIFITIRHIYLGKFGDEAHA